MAPTSWLCCFVLLAIGYGFDRQDFLNTYSESKVGKSFVRHKLLVALNASFSHMKEDTVAYPLAAPACDFLLDSAVGYLFTPATAGEKAMHQETMKRLKTIDAKLDTMKETQDEMANQLGEIAVEVHETDLVTAHGFDTLSGIAGAFIDLKNSYMDSKDDTDFPARAVGKARFYTQKYADCVNAPRCLSKANMQEVMHFCGNPLRPYNKVCASQLASQMMVARIQYQFIESAEAIWTNHITDYDANCMARFKRQMNEYVDVWKTNNLPENECAIYDKFSDGQLQLCEEQQIRALAVSPLQCEVAHVADVKSVFFMDGYSAAAAQEWLQRCCCQLDCSNHPFVGDNREHVCTCPTEPVVAGKRQDYAARCFAELSDSPQGEGVLVDPKTKWGVCFGVEQVGFAEGGVHFAEGGVHMVPVPCMSEFSSKAFAAENNYVTLRSGTLSWHHHELFTVDRAEPHVGTLTFDAASGRLSFNRDLIVGYQSWMKGYELAGSWELGWFYDVPPLQWVPKARLVSRAASLAEILINVPSARVSVFLIALGVMVGAVVCRRRRVAAIAAEEPLLP